MPTADVTSSFTIESTSAPIANEAEMRRVTSALRLQRSNDPSISSRRLTRAVSRRTRLNARSWARSGSPAKVSAYRASHRRKVEARMPTSSMTNMSMGPPSCRCSVNDSSMASSRPMTATGGADADNRSAAWIAVARSGATSSSGPTPNGLAMRSAYTFARESRPDTTTTRRPWPLALLAMSRANSAGTRLVHEMGSAPATHRLGKAVLPVRRSSEGNPVVTRKPA